MYLIKKCMPIALKERLKILRDFSVVNEIRKKEKDLVGNEWYSYEIMKENTLNYLKSLQVSSCKFKFSESVKKPTLYASAFAFMLKSWFEVQTDKDKKEWAEYFNSFQRDDGLFADIDGEDSLFENGDGWGARHLAGHMIIVYAKLGLLPEKEFKFLEFLSNPDEMIKFLNQLNFHNMENGNKIMNYGILLQYSRDFLGMDKYKDSIIALEEWLVKHINKQTGLWNNHEKASLQGWTNFSYHLWPILSYDNITIPYAKNAIDIILDNQNKVGGFSDKLISSACSDIDAIEPLIRLSSLNNHYRDNDIRKVISRAYQWVMLNKKGNGFMFEYGRPFVWGGGRKHLNLYSKKGEANIFATWFRLLSIIYMNQYLGIDTCKLMKIPGYEIAITKDR